jgi:lysozyme
MATPRIAPVPQNGQVEQQLAAAAAQPTHLSDEGHRFIRVREAVRDTYYNDQGGLCTYGVGILVQPPRPCTPEELTTHLPGEQIEASLAREIARAEAGVRRNISAPLTQSQFDALVSITFNTGPGSSRRHNGAQPIL